VARRRNARPLTHEVRFCTRTLQYYTKERPMLCTSAVANAAFMHNGIVMLALKLC
jgi:hypothetical protein